jgi:hypothetical protein
MRLIMSIKYLYLDDEDPKTVRPYTRQILSKNTNLAIEHLPPLSYDKQIRLLQTEEYDGLILDLRLDQNSNWQDDTDKTKAMYRAATLAQEMRTRAAEGGKDFPIILWSTDEKLRKSYLKDDTSHDLFDLKCVKSDIEDTNLAKEIAVQLVSLAEGYKSISKSKKIRQLLAFEESSFLDPRILAYLEELLQRHAPPHEYARFVLKDLLDTSGPLIDERTSAARLGVDMGKSKDWPTLLGKLKKSTYQGVFKEGWPRWWAYYIEEWWDALSKDMPPLRSTPAAERVARLQKKFRLKELTKAEPIRPDYSQAYWTICQATQRPLDPRDGFVLDVETKLWQSKEYVSSHAELTGERQRKGLRLDPLEVARVSRLKKAA